MEIPFDEISFEASRASGPGGQHVQKTSSRITLRWNVSKSFHLDDAQKAKIIEKLSSRINKDMELIIHVESHRSQHRNKATAYRLLNALVTESLKIPKIRKKTKPKRSAIETRLKEKSLHSQKKSTRKTSFNHDQ